MTRNMIRAVLLVSCVGLIPAVGAIAAVDNAIPREFEQFINVYERVRADYVDKVDDKKLIKGAIDGMLASLD